MAKWEAKSDEFGVSLDRDGISIAHFPANFAEASLSEANEIARKLNAFDEMLADIKRAREYADSLSYSTIAKLVAVSLDAIIAKAEAPNV